MAEVDATLDETRAAAGRLAAEQHQLQQAIARLETQIEAQAGTAEEAYRAGETVKVDAALAAQVALEDQLAPLQQQLAALEPEAAELETALHGLLAKRRELAASSDDEAAPTAPPVELDPQAAQLAELDALHRDSRLAAKRDALTARLGAKKEEG